MRSSASLLLVLAIPLLILNVVGTIWQLYARADIGLRGTLNALGISFNYTAIRHAWLTRWQWTFALTCYCVAGFADSCRYQPIIRLQS